MAKKKRSKHTRRRRKTSDGEPAMSAVIVKLAEPWLKKYGTNPKRAESVIAVTIAAWNKALLPADAQKEPEKELLDTVFPPGASAEDLGALVQMMDQIEERRKKLFPKIRKIIVNYEVDVTERGVSLNVGSAPIPAGKP